MRDKNKGNVTKVRLQNVGNQYFAVLIANLICIGHGNLLGWMSPSLPTLLSETTPLKTGPLNNEQLSWVGSINSIGALCGTFSTGLLTTFIGCKRAMIFLTLPSLIFWVLVFIGDTYYHVLIARIFTGWTGGGIQTTLILFTSDIANDNIRGRLGCFTPLARNIGILMAYIVGAAVNYFIVPCIFIFIPILFVVCFSFLPNTPQYHLLRGESKEAEDSLKFYKGFKGKNDEESNALNEEFERLKSIAHEKKADEKIDPKDIFNKAAIRGLVIGVVLAWLTQLTGTFIFSTYAVLIFKKVGVSRIDPYVASIVMACVQIFGSFCTTQISDHLGRKFLVLSSLFGAAFGLCSFAMYAYLGHVGFDLSSYDWIPVICLCFVIFIASAGIIPLAVVCTVENLPSKIRTLGLTISTFGYNFACFTCLKLFPLLMEMIGLHCCMAILGIGCILGALFVFTVMEETMGRSLEQVDKEVARVHKKSYGQLPTYVPTVETCPDKK
ncbi:facilitated trehalose transporter Tret1-like [Sitodiplosis mosellana]|uniref:facilitated trehalose transporter Tret1-like n=1 Tax=Sitodiplosis mosellana TaxID=263140 RepID=UPI0024442A06|nr:facilitated trehalose transporter Tret1-like [Sitodiplosis mosellana]